MSDNRPRRVDRKQRLIAPLSIGAVVALLGAAALFFAYPHRPAPEQPAPAASASQPTPAPSPPSLTPPLTRQELLRQANAAAAAFAAEGRQVPPGPDPFVGRRFDLALPFGCAGPGVSPPGGQETVEYDPDKQTLRLSVRRATWTTLPLVQDLPDRDDIEVVEGFWIPRPWIFADKCPARREQPEPATPTPAASLTLGLAQVFAKGASRVPRRGDRPYELVRRISDENARLLAHAYRVRLQGRIVGFSDGRALHCWSESPDHRPVCLFSVSFERVSLEDATDDEVLSQWPD